MARSFSAKRYVLVPATAGEGSPAGNGNGAGDGDGGVRFRRLGLARIGDQSRSALGESRHERLEQLAFPPVRERSAGMPGEPGRLGRLT